MLHNRTVGAQRVPRETSRSPEDLMGNSRDVQWDADDSRQALSVGVGNSEGDAFWTSETVITLHYIR